MTLFLAGSAMAGLIAGVTLKATGLVFVAGAGAIAGTAVLMGVYGPTTGAMAALGGLLAFNAGVGLGYGLRAAHRARERARRAEARKAGAAVLDRGRATAH